MKCLLTAKKFCAKICNEIGPGDRHNLNRPTHPSCGAARMRDINAILTSKFKQSVEQRFKRHFVASDPNDCWEWRGLRGSKGYGLLSVSVGRGTWNEGAHRLVYLLTNGPLPDLPEHGQAHVLHRCDNPPCVNPAHLFVGTYGDNNRDKAAKGRAPRGETHPITRLTEAQVRALRSDPRSQRVLAKVYGIADSTVHRIKHAKAWAHVAGPVVTSPRVYIVGEAHLGAQLTEEIVRAIRASQETNNVLMARYGVSRSIIQRARTYKTWKHVI